MKSNGLVSVLMPFYNSEKFIQEAITSVCAQTYPHWELLLIDDGSTDSSPEIARHFIRQYPEKIHYLAHEEHQNRGISAAQNLGLRNAHGDYIAILDSDDVWLPSKLEDQIAILTSHPDASMVYGNTLYWYSWIEDPEFRRQDYQHHLGVPANTVIQPPELLVKCLLGTAMVPCTCSVLIRRSALRPGDKFEEELRVYTDQSFYTKLLLREAAIASDKCWDKYRRHPASSTWMVEKKNEAAITRQAFLSWAERYLEQQGLENTQVWRVVQRELWLNAHPRVFKLQRRFIRKMKDTTQTFRNVFIGSL